ncbi:MAG: hypothetical protein ACRCU2_22125 [Planktothrix sp.]
MSTNPSQGPQSDIILNAAVVQATSNLETEKKNKNTQVECMLTESELKKMQALSKALRTSISDLAGRAISYANFVHHTITKPDPKKPEIETQKIWQEWKDGQLKHYHNELDAQKDLMKDAKQKDRYQRKFMLTQELTDKLEELGMKKTPEEGIFLGVILLHEKLITNPTLPVTQPIQV